MFNALKRKKVTFFSQFYRNRVTKLLVSSVVMFVVLLFPNMRYAFAEEIGVTEIIKPSQQSKVTDKTNTLAQVLLSLSTQPSTTKLKQKPTKSTLTVLTARESTPTLPVKTMQKTRSQLIKLEDRANSPIKAERLPINSIAQTVI